MFTGRRFDEETGWFYFRYRYYSSLRGRFASRDPVGYDAGSLGLYEYVSSKPTSAADPLGQYGIVPRPLLTICKSTSGCRGTGVAQYIDPRRRFQHEIKFKPKIRMPKKINPVTQRLVQPYFGYECICYCLVYGIWDCGGNYCLDDSKKVRAKQRGYTKNYPLTRAQAGEAAAKCIAHCARQNPCPIP